MNEKLYVMLMENKNPLNDEIIKKHVEHLKTIDKQGILYLCGPFSNYSGGIVILKTKTLDEAYQVANEDPFIKEGYKTFTIRVLEIANKDNNYGI